MGAFRMIAAAILLLHLIVLYLLTDLAGWCDHNADGQTELWAIFH